jgi:transcriptional regulator HMO1
MSAGFNKQKLADVFFQLSRACQDLGTILLQEEKVQLPEPSSPVATSPVPISPISSKPVITKKEGNTPSAGNPTKKEKDPNAPKKPLSAYMIFYQENYARLARENSSNAKGIVEIGKLVSELWKTVDHCSYEEKAKEAKENYAVQFANYNKTKADSSEPLKPILTEKRDSESSQISEEKPKKRAKTQKSPANPTDTVKLPEPSPMEPLKVPEATTEQTKQTKKRKEKTQSTGTEILEKIPSSPLVTDSQSTVVSVVDQETGEKKKEKKKHHHHKHNQENKISAE